jgi:hypothetical protein
MSGQPATSMSVGVSAITTLPSGPAREDLNEAQMFCHELTS